MISCTNAYHECIEFVSVAVLTDTNDGALVCIRTPPHYAEFFGFTLRTCSKKYSLHATVYFKFDRIPGH